MKIWLRIILLATLVLPGTRLPATPPALPEFPPLQFHPPKPDRYVLPNGVVVFLLEDHELPLIRLTHYFRAGSVMDPAGKAGLASLYGEVLSEGGSLAYKPETIETLLDRKAASLNFGVGLENGEGSLSCRKEDFDVFFPIYVDLVLNPQFRKDKLDLAKGKAIEGLRRMNDQPEDVARREFRRLMYGDSHPYARIPSPNSLKAIKREDLLAAHKQFMRPHGSFIAISGDFQSTDMMARLKTAFASWEGSNVSWPAISEPPAATERRVFYIQRPINQSQIRIGNLGLARHSPDHFAWEVLNELWGGSATSRLFRTVRTQMGLAYSVGSGYTEPGVRGLVVAVSQTRGSQTIAATQAILTIAKGIRETPFTAVEIQNAKEAIRNRFIENFTSSSQIASYKTNLEYFGFPDDYMDTYQKKIDAVTVADIQRVAAHYLQPDQATLLLMGDLSTFDKPVSTLGKPREVQILDYSKDENSF